MTDVLAVLALALGRPAPHLTRGRDDADPGPDDAA